METTTTTSQDANHLMYRIQKAGSLGTTAHNLYMLVPSLFQGHGNTEKQQIEPNTMEMEEIIEIMYTVYHFCRDSEVGKVPGTWI